MQCQEASYLEFDLSQRCLHRLITEFSYASVYIVLVSSSTMTEEAFIWEHKIPPKKSVSFFPLALQILFHSASASAVPHWRSDTIRFFPFTRIVYEVNREKDLSTRMRPELSKIMNKQQSSPASDSCSPCEFFFFPSAKILCTGQKKPFSHPNIQQHSSSEPTSLKVLRHQFSVESVVLTCLLTKGCALLLQPCSPLMWPSAGMPEEGRPMFPFPTGLFLSHES